MYGGFIIQVVHVLATVSCVYVAMVKSRGGPLKVFWVDCMDCRDIDLVVLIVPFQIMGAWHGKILSSTAFTCTKTGFLVSVLLESTVQRTIKI